MAEVSPRDSHHLEDLINAVRCGSCGHYSGESMDWAEKLLKSLNDEAFLCLDCGVSTKGKNYYMVHKNIWLTANPQDHGMLCIPCLEGRLGRNLTVEDFTDAPVNQGFFEYNPKYALP